MTVEPKTCDACGEQPQDDLITLGDAYGSYDYCPKCAEAIDRNFEARAGVLQDWWAQGATR